MFLEALGADLVIGPDSMIINSSSPSGLSADRIVIGSNGSFHGAFAYNQLTLGSNTTLTGPETTPAPLPVLTLPAFQPATPGAQNKVVGSGQTLNLPAGDYGFLIANGTVILDGNFYNFQQIILGSGARIEATMPVDIRVAQNIQAGQSIFIGPAPTAPGLSARDIMIDVGGYLATSQWATVHANIHTQEKIVFGEGTKAVGAFFTRIFVGGKFSEFMLDSAYAPFCGDGNVDPGEQCDDGDNNTGEYNGCNADCTLGPFCGDGVMTPPEECDDGNTVDGDGCSADCNVIENFCGDGIVDPAEECDDGDDNTGEYGGCTPGCTLGPFCGDGELNGPEVCDDGNAVDGDGCSADCSVIENFCGDGVVTPPERCDTTADGCFDTCELAPNYLCDEGGPCVCVDGFGDCNADAADGCEAELRDSPENCGGCGVVCEPGSTCLAGECVL